ncbi:hypothetical protein Salat_1016200 [Sesamum alatum]|uniref:Uncharacterized protein n=1 Tax=Sesamum alatum TaxID=300844 RepID=A0AAE1YLD9_9LAMI|nr:hypothetical protein Salat_1016200 [Sesamum alatum]
MLIIRRGPHSTAGCPSASHTPPSGTSIADTHRATDGRRWLTPPWSPVYFCSTTTCPGSLPFLKDRPAVRVELSCVLELPQVDVSVKEHRRRNVLEVYSEGAIPASSRSSKTMVCCGYPLASSAATLEVDVEANHRSNTANCGCS